MSRDTAKPSLIRRFLSRTREILGRYFVTGILVFAPIGVTAWAMAWIVQRLDNALLPHVLAFAFPGLDDPPRLPLVGAVFTLLVILLLGVIARHFFGIEAVRVSERILERVPIARSIYAGVKQLAEAILRAPGSTAFRRVVLIEYPRKGIFAIAFTTGTARGLIQDITPEEMVNCFVPTTPNPTSGFYLLIPESEIRVIDMTVEDAFKLVMSGGLIAPASLGEGSTGELHAIASASGEAREDQAS